MHIPIRARVMQRFRFSRREQTHLVRLSFAERAINGSYGVILHSLIYELRLRLILGHEGGIFMKIKKKAKRISSVVLCFLMLLTTLPMTAITANAAAQAYIKYIDTEVYIGDVLNIIVGVNGGSTSVKSLSGAGSGVSTKSWRSAMFLWTISA